jgi:hypothetical protein
MGIEIPGWAGQLVIAAPFVLLAVVLLAFLARRREEPEETLPGSIGRDGEPAWRPPAEPVSRPPAEPVSRPLSEPVSRPLAEPASRPMSEPASRPLSEPASRPPQSVPAATNRPAPAPITPPAPVAAPAPAVDARPVAAETPPAKRPPTIPEVIAAIGKAEAEGKKVDVAMLSLYLARRKKADGNGIGIGDDLRRTIRVAAEIGHKELQGEARLDLGDDARAAGDLTTACEHWQLARSLFEEAKLPAKQEAAADRMRRFGCPTDWVLNDF